MVIKSILIKNPSKRSGARLTKPKRKNKSVDSPRMVEKVILVALGFAAVFWVFQSVVDVALFQEGSLFQQLLTPGVHDIWMRTLVICTLVMFGVYAQSILAERKRAQDELAYMAIHDPLTGLPNRVLFNDRLTLALAGTDRSQRKLAVMLLDLDQLLGAGQRMLMICSDTTWEIRCCEMLAIDSQPLCVEAIPLPAGEAMSSYYWR